MKKWIIIGIVAIVVVTGGIVAYGMIAGKKSTTANDNKGTTATTKTAKVDACAVIKKEMLESAFNLKFKDGVPQAGGTGIGNSTTNMCRYDEANDGSVTAMMKATNVSIQTDKYDTDQLAKTAMDTTRKTDKIGNTVYFVRTDVPGVGDEAFFFQGQAAGVLKTEEYMYARKANVVYHFVAVKLDGIDHAAARAAMTTIAKTAL